MALIKRNTAYALNDLVYTTFGIKLKCITAGTTDTDALNLPLPHTYITITDGTVTWEVVEENHVSIGTIISYMGNAVPERFLACDGTAYNIADYQALAEHINIEFGSYNYFGGDGTTTFAVPDLRGEFLRGTGTNSHTNQGSGANVGTHQDGTNHTSVYGWQNNTIGLNVANQSTTGSNVGISNVDKGIGRIGGLSATATSFSASSTVDYSTYTSRPTNTSVLYCIKYI